MGLSLAALVSRACPGDDGGDKESLRRAPGIHGFHHLQIWSRGVDVDHFHPIPGAELPYQGPIWLYVGRVAVEKNIEDFLKLGLPGTKVVVGDGPARAALTEKYPDVRFLGTLSGEALVRVYAASTVFVFPSRTDTFGLVLLEALACGVPVAAYPVQGPLDVVGEAPVGVLDEDLRKACLGALEVARTPVAQPPRVCPWPFLARLHPAIPEEYPGRTRPRLTLGGLS